MQGTILGLLLMQLGLGLEFISLLLILSFVEELFNHVFVEEVELLLDHFLDFELVLALEKLDLLGLDFLV